MGVVTSLFARKLVGVAGDAVDARDILGSVGLDPDGPWNPQHMLDEDTFYGMIERMATQMDVNSLPLTVGAAMRPDEYGALGLAWKAAPDLFGSFSRVARYWRLWTSGTRYELQATETGAWFIEYRDGDRRLGKRISIEADFASGVSLSRQVTQDSFAPLEVHFRHSAPNTTCHHAEYFQCPVHFGSDKDAMFMSQSSLSEPTQLGDAGITQFLVSHLDEELSKIKDESDLTSSTRDAIARSLSEGLPKMADIARGLGLSARSFHRRLSEQGVSFQTLTEQTRRDLAIGLLRDEAYSLSEVAFLTGFSDQSAFSRAFKRWTDTTPAVFRSSHP